MTGEEATENSSGCLFGIATRKAPDRLLRVAVTLEEAIYLTQDPSRIAVECRSLRSARWKEALA